MCKPISSLGLDGLPLGAHLTTPRRGYLHHGIYAGNGRVVHYAGFKRLFHRGPVEEIPLKDFARSRGFELKHWIAPAFSGAEVVERARSRIGENRYRFWSNNCEHFAEWCISGRARSPQVESWEAFARKALAVLVQLGALVFSVPSHALDLSLEETKPALRLTVAEDFVHALGSVLASARYGGAWGVRIGLWTHATGFEGGRPAGFAGANYMWTYGRWRAEFGTVWIDKTSDLNGTHWDFDVAAAYHLSGRWFLEWRHYSHGRKLGIAKDKANDGWNLIGAGVAF